METNNINRLRIAGRFCAKYSFIIGSIIALLFCLTGAVLFQIVGVVFAIAAVGLNLLVFALLFINILIYPHQYIEIGKTMILMLLNIPVAVFYLWLTQEFQHLPL
ncbi:hypothetical protein [Pedobacter psychroterrae]|uniref:LIVCS family branched-chain amino acid:cation transporter n=1 Tax=Pedobacter psychroterrae TaxID=2530453 RepID=A0A4R0NHA9_9SPHI|nr:hypothetical protein [Pedobacter psychroterrae]TCC99845.1 hypothetical protein EZ437_16515 [Pedobacter psychroterrae]